MTGPVRPLQQAVTVLMLHYLQEFLFLEQEVIENRVSFASNFFLSLSLCLSLTHAHTPTHTHSHK